MAPMKRPAASEAKGPTNGDSNEVVAWRHGIGLAYVGMTSVMSQSCT